MVLSSQNSTKYPIVEAYFYSNNNSLGEHLF